MIQHHKTYVYNYVRYLYIGRHINAIAVRDVCFFELNNATDDKKIATEEQITVCRDPKDDKFLSLAVSGEATHLVTNDKDLLVLHPFRGINILTSAEFLSA